MLTNAEDECLKECSERFDPQCALGPNDIEKEFANLCVFEIYQCQHKGEGIPYTYILINLIWHIIFFVYQFIFYIDGFFF